MSSEVEQAPQSPQTKRRRKTIICIHWQSMVIVGLYIIIVILGTSKSDNGQWTDCNGLNI